MKKTGVIIAILVAICLALMPAAGCGSSGSSKETAKEDYSQASAANGQTSKETAAQTEAETAETETAEPEELTDPGTCEYKDMVVTYRKCEIFTDQYGNSGLYVYFDFTNNSDQKQSFFMNFDASLYEGGVEADDIVVVVDDNKARDNYRADIKPGATVEVAKVFAVPESFPVILEVEPLITFQDEILMSIEISPEE